MSIRIVDKVPFHLTVQNLQSYESFNIPTNPFLSFLYNTAKIATYNQL